MGTREGMTREGMTREGMTREGMTREGMGILYSSQQLYCSTNKHPISIKIGQCFLAIAKVLFTDRETH